MDKRERIHLGVACYGDMDPLVAMSLMCWSFHLGRRMPEYDFSISFATKQAQWRAKNQLVVDAAESHADYVLILDDDMIPTVDLDWLRVLLDHRKEVIGALYFQRGGNYHPVAMRGEKLSDGKTTSYEFYDRSELVDGLMKVGVLGGGCQLIHMGVFKKIIQPWFYENGLHGQDVYFCQKIKEAGMECWLDTSIELGHMVRDRFVLERDTLPDNDTIKDTPYYQVYKNSRAAVRDRALAASEALGARNGELAEASIDGRGTI